jgi:putative hydrolase of the HAD superfamily
MQFADFDRKTNGSPFTNVEFVLFDAVGTLIYTDPSPAQLYQSVGVRFGYHLSVDEVQQRFQEAFKKHHTNGPTEESVERQRWRNVIGDVFSTGPDTDIFEPLWKHFSEPESWKVFPDVADIFAELEQRNLPFAIASNFDDRLVHLCKHLSPLNRVKSIFHSSAVGWSKPHPEFFSRVQRQLGVTPSRILLVGDDNEKDLGGALNAGWQALLIDRSGTRRDEQTVATLTEVLKFIR